MKYEMQRAIGRVSMADLARTITGEMPRRVGSEESWTVLFETRSTKSEAILGVQSHIFDCM